MAELESLPPDVAALLERVKEPIAMERSRADALESRLALALAASHALEGSLAAKSLGASAFAKLVAFLSRKATIAIGMLGLGVSVGAALHAAATPRAAPPLVISESRVPTTAPLPPVVTLPVVTPPAPASIGVAAPASTVGAAGTAVPSATNASTLAEERALLEMGRSALARGQSADAVAAARKHERTFPRGKLTEEREVLMVQALAASGARDEARVRAARFSQSYPNSIFGPAVRAAASP